jgi:phosphoserine phosphatase
MQAGHSFAGWRTPMGRADKSDLKMVVFDVDGTLVKGHSWQFVHEALGTWDEGRKYREMFFEGRISYEEWSLLDASLWPGLPLHRVKLIVDSMPYTCGAEETISTLRNKRFKVFLLSAGLSLVSERINRQIGVDGYLANELIVKDGFLTGEVNVNVSFHKKDEALMRVLPRWSLEMKNCVAVGDDPTLVPLFEKVGLSVAFNPVDETIGRKADAVVKSNDLRHILQHIINGPK